MPAAGAMISLPLNSNYHPATDEDGNHPRVHIQSRRDKRIQLRSNECLDCPRRYEIGREDVLQSEGSGFPRDHSSLDLSLQLQLPKPSEILHSLRAELSYTTP
ncbi:unnamed protein product [Nezara viridula]|uniref:Uncharacterized protein n=1 Tax=Nezara viridula TaxID=85310 RepID=A0A9P0EBG6_NEZVI|nr:unnamed protein product [Nezara viridula]